LNGSRLGEVILKVEFRSFEGKVSDVELAGHISAFKAA
jgi:hypothetical protein